MSLESQIFTVLGPLVSSRCYPDVFPQNKEGTPNPWPAIRYTFISVVPDQTICGSGNDPESDFRIQIDGIAATGVARDALRVAITTAMESFPITATVDSWSKDYDTETKGYRIQMDYFIQPSSA